MSTALKVSSTVTSTVANTVGVGASAGGGPAPTGDVLLLEDNDNFLLETGDALILE